MNIDRKKALILLTAAAVAAVMSGIVLNAYSAANACSAVNEEKNWNGFTGWINGRMMAGTQGWSHGWMRGRGCYGFVEVSEEFKENVINIARNDSDVQNLLADGYNITDVRPIINTIVEADGTVTMKATTAIVMLSQNTTGRAFVTVNIEEGKVTQIVILTRTVIEKP